MISDLVFFTLISYRSNGRTVYTKAYGFRDVQNKLPLTVGTVMAWASFTKVAFAYLVMQLVDNGVLDLDKPVQAYLPKPLPDYPGCQDLANDLEVESLDKCTAARRTMRLAVKS